MSRRVFIFCTNFINFTAPEAQGMALSHDKIACSWSSPKAPDPPRAHMRLPGLTKRVRKSLLFFLLKPKLQMMNTRLQNMHFQKVRLCYQRKQTVLSLFFPTEPKVIADSILTITSRKLQGDGELSLLSGRYTHQQPRLNSRCLQPFTGNEPKGGNCFSLTVDSLHSLVHKEYALEIFVVGTDR